MNQKSIWQQLLSLPPEAQKQAADFIAFLQLRYASGPVRKARAGKLSKEAFVGIWRNRRDLRDSARWVRDLRKQEWGE